MPKLFNGTNTIVKTPIGGGKNRAEIVWLEVTFASGVSTVATSSHEGVAVTRQGSTGIYDVVLPGAKKLVALGPPAIYDTNDDPAGSATYARYGVRNESAGTLEVAFFEAEGEVDDIAPADTQTVQMAFLAYQGL